MGPRTDGPELRVYLLVEELQRQFAAYMGTPTRARGYPPFGGQHSLIIEVAPGLAIERVIDLALKSSPEVEPGILFVERQFGVPKELIVAIWGLETDFGSGDMGKLPVFRVLATMAHDCRRTELFQGELLAALKIVQRGDLGLRDMIGAYAGEIGQTQFLPSSYIKYGVDYDGNGHVDLRHSVPDVLASTANLLHTSGFKMGQPFGEGTANFQAMREWNRSEVYRKTIGYFAERLMGR